MKKSSTESSIVNACVCSRICVLIGTKSPQKIERCVKYWLCLLVSLIPLHPFSLFTPLNIRVCVYPLVAALIVQCYFLLSFFDFPPSLIFFFILTVDKVTKCDVEVLLIVTNPHRIITNTVIPPALQSILMSFRSLFWFYIP